MDFPVQLEYVEAEPLAPVVEAIPFQVSLDRQVLGNELFPDIGVERQIKDGAVHIQHQGSALGKSGFRIECHCSILRGPASGRRPA